jgi:PAS domain-containing protein
VSESAETPWAAPRREEERDDRYPRPTTEHEIEVILARQLASYLAFPIVIVDPSHIVVYYNEPAEHMLGRRFDEGGPIPVAEWSRAFQFTDDAGEPIPSAEMPLGVALRQRQPAHRRFWLRGLDGEQHHMEERSIPLLNTDGKFLGALAVFTDLEP